MCSRTVGDGIYDLKCNPIILTAFQNTTDWQTCAGHVNAIRVNRGVRETGLGIEWPANI